MTLFIHSVKAQRLNTGLHIGTNLSGYVGGNKYKIYDTSYKVGYEIGGDIRYTLNCGINFTSGISFTQSQGKFSVMSDYYDATGQITTEFPEINTNILFLEIPLKVGYGFQLGGKTRLNPFAGIYGRYGLLSMKDDVREIGKTESEKWDCFKDYNSTYHHIDAMKRIDFGMMVGVEMMVADHYSISINYRRGLLSQSTQYGLRQQGVSLSLGYWW